MPQTHGGTVFNQTGSRACFLCLPLPQHTRITCTCTCTHTPHTRTTHNLPYTYMPTHTTQSPVHTHAHALHTMHTHCTTCHTHTCMPPTHSSFVTSSLTQCFEGRGLLCNGNNAKMLIHSPPFTKVSPYTPRALLTPAHSSPFCSQAEKSGLWRHGLSML